MELRRELSTLTSLDLPATLVFDYPSVTEMTGALSAMLPAASAVLAPAKPGQVAMPKVAVTKKGPSQQTAVAVGRDLVARWLPQVGDASASPLSFTELHTLKCYLARAMDRVAAECGRCLGYYIDIAD